MPELFEIGNQGLEHVSKKDFLNNNFTHNIGV